MKLNLIIFILQTAQVVLSWYAIWFAFIKHANTSDETLAALFASNIKNSGPARLNAAGTLLQIIQIGIADGIMASRIYFSSFESHSSLTIFVRSGVVG